MADHPIIPLITQLTEANRVATAEIARNSDFNRTIQASLAGINTQITQIAQGIRDLQARLVDSERQIGENQETIGQNQAENQRLVQESEAAIRERNDTAQQLADLGEQRVRIEEDAARREQANARQLQELQQERERETAELRNASAAERARLQQELDATNSQIAGLTQDNQNISEQSARDLAALDGQRGELQRELQESRAEIQRIEAARAGLDADSATLREENQRLNQLLSDALPQMQLAIENLGHLSNATGQDEINRIIEQINSQLTEINNLLGAQGAAAVAGPGDDGLAYHDAVQGSIDTSQQLLFNGRQQPLSEVIDFLKKKNNQMIRNKQPNNKYKAALDFINVPNTTFQEIVEYLTRINLRGGRKTRRKRRFGTRKGRKTRKIRKQRGGYHYSKRARRRSITTTARRTSTRRSSTKRSSSV